MTKKDKKQIITAILAFVICFLVTGVGASILITSREVSYRNNTSGLDSETVQDAIDELYINNCQKTSFKVGDYVRMTPSTSSYTVESKYTGYTDATETITPTELNLWRVIRVNSDGTYDAVSEYVSSTNVTFKGKTGYQSLVGYLNILASKYENPKYTVGSRIMGYNGQTEFITDTSYFDGTSTKVGDEWTSSTSGTPAEEYLGRGDELYMTDTNLVSAVYGNLIGKKVGTTTATTYWLGSRYYNWNDSTNFLFYGRYVFISGDIFRNYLYYYSGSNWVYNSNSDALRPIITLRSGLTATGSGTSGDPYVLE